MTPFLEELGPIWESYRIGEVKEDEEVQLCPSIVPLRAWTCYFYFMSTGYELRIRTLSEFERRRAREMESG